MCLRNTLAHDRRPDKLGSPSEDRTRRWVDGHNSAAAVYSGTALQPAIDLVWAKAQLQLGAPTVQDLRDIAANNPALWVD